MRTSQVVAAVAMLLPALSHAYEIDNANFCETPYALCASGSCQSIPGNSTHAECTCELLNGLNVGQTSCADRVNNVISTFSLVNRLTTAKPLLYYFPCTGSNAGQYASCYDSPCTVTNGVPKCICGLSSGNNHYLGTTCPTSADETHSLCKSLRVSSSAAGPQMPSSGYTKDLAQFYGVGVAQPSCNAPGS